MPHIKDKQSISQLFALLRSSLWEQPVDTTLFTEYTTDWNYLRQLALEQTVGALVYHPILTLPEAFRPCSDWLRATYPLTVRTSQAHDMLNRSLAESVGALKAAGLHPVLLKGQAYAQVYPQPTTRQCGDIDLYIGEQDYPLACHVARRQGWEAGPEVSTPEACAKHYGCYLKGVRIELHRMAAQMDSPAIDKRFRAWSHDQLSPSCGNRRILYVGKEEVLLPTPLFDVVFVFLHLYHHFITGGVGLRQLCDWALLLHTHREVIDPAELEHLLRSFGLLRGWQLFTPIAVEQLGLPAGECPLYEPRFRSKSMKVLSIILREGNFGKHAPRQTERPEGYYAGKLHSFFRYQKRLASLFLVAPKSVTTCCGHYVYAGIRQIIYDKRSVKKQ